MKDFLKNYKKRKIISNTGVVFASLVLALGINFFLIDSTNLGNSLKASVLNSTSSKDLSDVYLIKNGDKITLKNSKKMNNVDKLSLGLFYNPENVELSLSSNIKGVHIMDIGNDPGVNRVVIGFSGSTDIENGTNILDIKTIKKIDKTEFLNLLNPVFTDKSGIDYYLTPTSGFDF